MLLAMFISLLYALNLKGLHLPVVIIYFYYDADMLDYIIYKNLFFPTKEHLCDAFFQEYNNPKEPV